MPFQASSDIYTHLNDAEADTSKGLQRSGKVVGDLMSKWPNDRGLFVQLRRLAEFISKTREELSALRPDQVKHDFIPKATDELDAIVEATASATHRIMDAADVLMDVAGRINSADAELTVNAVTSIYEACTFQDITGQRVTKVVTMLKVIEERIDKMIEAMGEIEEAASAHGSPTPASAPTGVAAKTESSSQQDIDALFDNTPKGSELHGPALPGQGKTQAEIDALLNDGG